MRLTDVPTPETDAAVAANQVARRYLSSALYAHSARTYLCGVVHAHGGGLTIDTELLYVAAMLHDLPLADPFGPRRVRPEIVGGELAWVFAAAAGWSDVRRSRVARVLAAPGSPTPGDEELEAHVLSVATGMDLHGTGLDTIPQDFRADLAAAWPRLGLDAQDLTCLQARHHPPHTTEGSAAGSGEGEVRELPT